MTNLINRSNPITIKNKTSASKYFNISKIRSNVKNDIDSLITALKQRYKSDDIHMLSLSITIQAHGTPRGFKGG